MSISDSLAALRGVRDAIRDAIVGKGGSLPPGSPMESYAAAITNLPSSGGGGSVEIPFRSRLTIPGDTDPWHLNSLTATKVTDYAFYMDKLLTTVSLPAVTSIGSSAFNGCSALKAADFPAATDISGTYAFQNCSALTSLTLSKNQVATLSNTSAFTGTPIASGTGYVYVPDDLVGQYKAATNWATYANQIRPISQKP